MWHIPPSTTQPAKENLGLTRRAEKTSEARKKEKPLFEHQPKGGAIYDFSRAQAPHLTEMAAERPNSRPAPEKNGGFTRGK